MQINLLHSCTNYMSGNSQSRFLDIAVFAHIIYIDPAYNVFILFPVDTVNCISDRKVTQNS